jgi:hypothetical protein
VVGASGRASQVALVVAALALLAGAPAVLVAVHVRNPWALGGAIALAAVVVAFGAVWQQRYTGLLQRRDEQAFKTEDGCLVLADGRPPRVGDITDSVLLGVHKAASAALPTAGQGSGLSAGGMFPPTCLGIPMTACANCWWRAGSFCWSVTRLRARLGPRSRP